MLCQNAFDYYLYTDAVQVCMQINPYIGHDSSKSERFENVNSGP